ncbi:MAG: serine/threonine protein kinase [Deltaproteobacteria bacterium]|nr:serine/threonine protein kinase [Deltaproteobacteria bacterium]MBK8237701.1 serine/threonine protein kinase [Deltaproteobacteria bacterium]MBP7291769.1 serine/threonine protein kinase [Nannocystaceae bacterium]
MDRIGEYLVRRLVGEGGMGKVYEAEERLSKRRVALKVLRPELARSEEGRRLFLNEMTILASLDHPNIVRALSCSEIEGELVMALEFLSGFTLREVLTQRGRLPWAEVVGIAAQMAAALGAAHRQQPPIVHRDLKPENVIVMPDGQVKVMDFGIAKVMQALSKTTTHSVGTLQYMSPEQIDATGVDARSDLYSLGLVMYEMLAGRAPFESASPRELLNLQCTAAAPALPDEARAGLPRGLERLVYQLLEKQPDARPADAAAVLMVLEDFRTDVMPGGRTLLPAANEPATRTGATVVPGVTAPAPARAATRPRDSTPRIADTIGLVERAAGPRTIGTGWAIAMIVAATAAAAGITYVVRTQLATPTASTSPATIPATVRP